VTGSAPATMRQKQSDHRSFRRSSVPSYLWPLTLLAAVVAFVATLDTRTLFVTVPLGAGVLITGMFLLVLWRRRDGTIPWFEIGAVYIAVVALYLSYPLIGFLALDGTYTPLNDARLYMMQPEADDMGRIGWLYVCHLLGFATTYLLVRGRLRAERICLNRPALSVVAAVVAVYLSIEAFEMFVGLFYNTSSDTYFESYLVARRLPTLLAQLLNHLNGMKYVLSLMLLATLFSRYPASRWLVAGWLIAVGVITVARLGNRTELVLLLVSATMMYDTLIRPIRPRLVMAVAVCGLVGFVAFGAMRNGMSLTAEATNPFSYSTEFESLFANVVHLDRVRPTLERLPAAFYLADLGALVPQQLAPFTKIDRADWYVNKFFPEYAQAGGGLAFGTISESVLMAGWPSALAAGAALGFCFASIHRFYVRHAGNFWVFVLYVWLTTLSYQSFRNGTFALLVLFLYRFVFAVIFVNLLAALLRPTMQRRLASAAGAIA
jgi:TM2 domain-containing membrane protein YozV